MRRKKGGIEEGVERHEAEKLVVEEEEGKVTLFINAL